MINALGLFLLLLFPRVAGPVNGPLRAERAEVQEPEPLLVLAASSLQDVLPSVARAWRDAGGSKVRFSFDATSRLAPQILRGAPADVFISADHEWMEWLIEQDVAIGPEIVNVAANRLVFVVPASEEAPPPDVRALGAHPAMRIAMAGENVPAGRYGTAALQAAGLWDDLEERVVRGGSVRGTLEWVARGEADGGVVYETDALAEPRVRLAFAFDESTYPPVVYPGAVVGRSERPAAARAFLDFMVGAEGIALFGAAGFQVGSPDPGGRPAPAATLPDPVSAVRLSFLVALAAVALGLVPAIGAGWLLARRDFPGRGLLSTLLLAPLVIPPVVTGFLLLSVLGGQSPLGRALAAVGLSVPFTLVGATLAALVVGFPLYVVAVRGAFEVVDPHLEELSWTLGVPPRRTFFRVSLPLALPGIAAGALLAFARALGEFGATVVLAGNVEGQTRTIALAVYALLESPSGHGAIWVLVGASVALSLAALMGFEALTRRQRRLLEDRRGR
ncbi:MAG: molybdate ABC transporter permease subunit [Longimicrobiales bacterium]